MALVRLMCGGARSRAFASTAVTATSTKDIVAPSGYSFSGIGSYINASQDTSYGFTIAGAEVGATYNYTISGTGHGSLSGSGTVPGAGSVSITGLDLSVFSDGTITFSATLTDPAGNTGTAVTATPTKDILAPSGYSFSGIGSYINASQDTSYGFTIAGAEVGATYNYTISDSVHPNITGTGSVTGASVSITGLNLAGLNDGTISFSATLTDPAGNLGTAVTATSTKDTVAPILIGAAEHETTVDNKLFDATGDTLTLTFSEPVTATSLHQSGSKPYLDDDLAFSGTGVTDDNKNLPTDATLSSLSPAATTLTISFNASSSHTLIPAGSGTTTVSFTANSDGITDVAGNSLDTTTGGSPSFSIWRFLGIDRSLPQGTVAITVGPHAAATSAGVTASATPSGISLNSFDAIRTADSALPGTSAGQSGPESIPTEPLSSSPVLSETVLPGLSRAPLAGESYGDFHALSRVPIEEQAAIAAGSRSAPAAPSTGFAVAVAKPSARRATSATARPQASTTFGLASVVESKRADVHPTTLAQKSVPTEKRKAVSAPGRILYPRQLSGSILFIQILGGLLLLGLPLTRRRVRKPRK